MAIRDVFKISRKTFLYPSGWIDLESLRYQNITIRDILKGMFSVRKPDYEETFEEAVERLVLSKADVKRTATLYRFFAIFFLILGLLSLIYSFYLLFHRGLFLGWLLGVSVSLLFFGQAFKYDFWSFQMRSQKLGSTFQEWKRAITRHKGTPP